MKKKEDLKWPTQALYEKAEAKGEALIGNRQTEAPWNT